MRLTQPQAVALAHWTPGVAACRPWYARCPGLPSVYALSKAGLLADADVGIVGRFRPFILTPAGCAVLARLIATEAVVIPAGCVRLHSDADDCGLGCWVIALCRKGGPSRQTIRVGIAWAPTAEEWAMGRAERDATEGGAAMAARR